MACLYQKRSPDMLSLIRSAVLYNGAIVRSPHNVHIIENLKKFCQDVLKLAKAQKLNADLVEIAQAVKQKFQRMRLKVNQVLSNMPVSKINNLGEELSEKKSQDKIKNVKKLQKQITDKYIEIMSELSNLCLNILGKPPCKFALVGMGSLARQEITPYSDFEHIIVLEEIKKQKPGNKEKILNYFRWFSVIFQIILINIQETIIPSVVIPSLNNHPEHGDWFYDKITTRGISFDGMMPHASKFPLGRLDPTEDKPWRTELIKPISEMLEYLTFEQDLKNGYHLKDILTKVCYVSGEQSIFKMFEKRKNTMLDKEAHSTVINEIRKVTNDDLDEVATRKNLLELKKKNSFNIKKVIYRSTTLFISALGRLNRIHSSSCFSIVKDLERKQKISKFAKNKLLFAVAIACEARLRWYMKCKRQNDIMESKVETQTAIQLLSDLIGKSSVYEYFKTAYALQCGLTKEIKAKKLHFYSNPTRVNSILYYCLDDNQKFIYHTLNSWSLKANNNQKLYTIDECLKLLNKKAIEPQPNKISKKINSDTAKKDIVFDIANDLEIFERHDEAKEYFEIFIETLKKSDPKNEKELSFGFYKIGKCLMEMGKLTKAMDYFKRSLEIKQRLSCVFQGDQSLSDTFHTIGYCLMEMDKLTDAMEYLQKAFKIKQIISVDSQNDQSLSITLHSIGCCLMKMGKLTEAMDHFQSAFKIKQQISLDPQIDPSLSITLQSIGECLMKMDKLIEAMDHFQKSLQIKKRLSSDPHNDSNIAATLHSIGCCVMKMDKLTEAMDYLQRSLYIKQQISLDPQNDRSLSLILHSIGECLMKMDKLNDAMDHLQRSQEIKQRLSLDLQKDRSLSVTLHCIGECLMKMDNLTEAMDYFQRSLEIKQQISLDPQKDRNLSVTLHCIGECLMEMDKFTEAMDYFQRSLKIQKQISLDPQKDRSLSFTSHCIGECLMKMDKLTEAMAYFQRSLKIKQEVSLDFQKDRDLSTTLHCIGECLMKMNKLTDALAHFQESLEIDQNISPDPPNDQGISISLHSIGCCLMKMNKLTEAMYHFQKSLEIDLRLLLDPQSNRNLSITLHCIGQCLMKMDKATEAMNHFQKLLEIKKPLLDDPQNDQSVSNTLYRMPKGLLKMDQLTEAIWYFKMLLEIKTNYYQGW